MKQVERTTPLSLADVEPEMLIILPTRDDN